MPPARRGPAPLTDDDVARVREELAAGAEPRVQLLVDTPAAPAGTRGPVVALRDPGAEPEFIVLRVAGDELPFSPAELTWPVRARAARGGAATSAAADPEETSAPEPPVEPTGAREASVETGDVRSAPDAAAQTTVGGDTAPAPSGGPAADETGATRPRRPRTSGTSPVGAQPFTVTLRFTGTGWTAETTRGGRRGKARPVPVAAVRGLAERLDDPELRRAVLGAVEACREQALARAERLRAELEQVETVLAQLDDDD